MSRPKLCKGADVFAEIAYALCRQGYPIHVVLAGPRRHWLRHRLFEMGVPFTFVGHTCTEDDLKLNTLPRETLNLLYNLIDSYVVSSRSEGGPRSILEAAAAGCKIISTPVGLAEDVLEPCCLYYSPDEAVRLITCDIETGSLAETLPANSARARGSHGAAALAPLFEDLYRTLEDSRPFQECNVSGGVAGVRPRPAAPLLKRALAFISSAKLKVSLWHEFHKPPWGGGNQFMLLMKKAFAACGVAVNVNRIGSDIDAYLLNAIHFDIDRFLKCGRRHDLRVVHRIDGPISRIRGFDLEKDELCFSLNRQFASATVLQSAWTYQRIVEMGYQPVNPVIIHNTVDPDIFHPCGKHAFDRNRKTRLISTSWSGNPRKGGPVYKWIDQNLDWKRFEYSFVGNVSEHFNNIRRLPPVPSEGLAGILREHDIYIAASRNDPCSNAVLEALACGLPVLYLNDGGHPELVGQGGLPFAHVEEIIPQLDRLVENYAMFQRLITVQDIGAVADKYLTLLREVAQ